MWRGGAAGRCWMGKSSLEGPVPFTPTPAPREEERMFESPPWAAADSDLSRSEEGVKGAARGPGGSVLYLHELARP